MPDMSKLALSLAAFSSFWVALSIEPAGAQDRIGVTAAVNRDSALERGSARRTVTMGQDVAFRDRIVTSGTGLVQVLFVDGSAFTVGSNSQVIVDEFVFNPATGSGALVSEVTRGALRFVGGRLSKGENTVQFRTPVGTLGVRGAIVDIDLQPGCLANGRCPVMTATLVYGEELTLTQPDGMPARIWSQGNAFVVFDAPDGVQKQVEIVPVRTLDQTSLQGRLGGQPGQGGGAPVAPTDASVQASGFSDANSGQSPFAVRPAPREVVATASAPDDETPGIGTTTRVIDQTVREQPQGDIIRDEVLEDEERVRRRSLTGVFGTPPDGYTTANGVVVIDNPAPLGINAFDRDGLIPVRVVEAAPGQPVALEVADLVLPFPAALGQTSIPATTSALLDPLGGGVVTGTILRGPAGFALYHLNIDVTGPGDDASLFVVVGQPTPRAVFYPGEFGRPATVRTYTFGQDYQRTAQGISSNVPLLNPLVARAFGNDFVDSAAVTPFYVIDRQNVLPNSATLHAAMLIDGLGPAQRSMIVSDAGTVYANNADGVTESLGFGGTRRGSYRIEPGAASVFMRGGTGSVEIENPVIFTALAGSQGEAFVYSSGLGGGGLARNERGREEEFIDVSLSDPLRTPASPDRYSSVMIPGFLSGTAPLDSFVRPGGNVLGFAAGMVETQGGAVIPYRSAAPDDVQISFRPASGTLGGLLTVHDVTNADTANRFRYAFGFDVTGTYPSASGTRSSYLDATRFAANSTGPSNAQGGQTTLLFTDPGGAAIQHRPFDGDSYGTGADPGTYVVSAGLVPQPQLFAASGVTPCTCAFMQWGWWGSQTEFRDPSLPGGERRDIVHLGTFATGDIPTLSQLPTVGTGTFTGHAIGNVAAATGAGTAQYIAAGSMALEYDFGARTGVLGISNFDSRSVSGNMTGSANPFSPNSFAGSLSGSGLDGTAVGAFARGPGGPADGVLGSFDLNGPGYLATGTFMGQRGP